MGLAIVSEQNIKLGIELRFIKLVEKKENGSYVERRGNKRAILVRTQKAENFSSVAESA